MELERRLAGEAEPHDVARHAPPRRRRAARMNAGGSARPQRGEQLGGVRAGDVDRADRRRPVDDPDVAAERLGPVSQPGLGAGRAAGGEGEREPALAVAARSRRRRTRSRARRAAARSGSGRARGRRPGTGRCARGTPPRRARRRAPCRASTRRRARRASRTARYSAAVSPYVHGRHQPPNRSMRAPRARCSASSAVRRTGGKNTPAGRLLHRDLARHRPRRERGRWVARPGRPGTRGCAAGRRRPGTFRYRRAWRA